MDMDMSLPDPLNDCEFTPRCSFLLKYFNFDIRQILKKYILHKHQNTIEENIQNAIEMSIEWGTKKNYGNSLKYDGATYYSDGTQQLKDGSTNYYWKCSKHRESGCKHRVTTKAISETSHRIFKEKGEHSHEVSTIVANAKLARADLTNRARTTNYSPETVMMDFEQALHNAFRRIFPRSLLSACYFHLCQSLRRKIKTLGLTVALRNNTELAASIAMFRALAFLPPRNVVRGFVLLKNHIETTFNERADFPQIQAFVNYFEETYIGTVATRNRRNAPLFGIELWNVYNRTMEGNPRTNNSVEGSHNKLHSFFNCDHPGFFKFVELLRLHLKTLESDVFDLRANKPLRPVKREWKLLEERRVAAIENFNENDIFGFLRSLAIVLAAN